MNISSTSISQFVHTKNALLRRCSAVLTGGLVTLAALRAIAEGLTGRASLAGAIMLAAVQ